MRPHPAWLAALSLTSSAWAQDAAPIMDRLAATVDGDVVTLSEVYDLGRDFIADGCAGRPDASACQREKELQVLDTLVKWELVADELQRLEMDVTQDDVDRAIDSVLRDNQFGDRAELRQAIEGSGTSWEAYREQLLDTLRVQRFQQAVLLPRALVTADEVQDLYQRTKRRESRQEATLSAFGIPLPVGDQQAVRSLVAQIVDEIASGELAFEEAVRLYDQARIHGAVSGRAFGRGQLAEALDQVAFEGEVLAARPAVVEMGGVLFVVRVMERVSRAGDLLPFEQVEAELRQQVLEGKLQEAEEEWYQMARRGRAVRILLEGS